MSRTWIGPLALLLVVACGGGGTEVNPPPPPPPPPPSGPGPVASVTIGGETDVIIGRTTQLTATVRDAQGTTLSGRTVAWTSATPDIASVTSAGLVSGETLGPVVIEATVDGIKGQATVRIGSGWAASGSRPTTGRIELPTGTTLTATALRIHSSLGRVTISAAGEFTIPALTDGPQLVAAYTTDRRPILLGWLGAPTAPPLSARTTAEVLAYFDLGGPFLPSTAREFILTELAKRSELTVLVNAIKAALTAPAASVTLDVPAVNDARRQVRTLLVPTALKARAAIGRPQRTVQIDPLAHKSGIRPHEVELNQISITNQYRRRAVALVDRIWHRTAAGDSVGSLQRVAKVDVAGVGGVTSTGGLLADVVTGDLAWAETESGPFATPMFPEDARATHYRLRVLGPGLVTQTERFELSAADRAELDVVTFKGIFLDFVLPTLMNVVLDGKVAGDRIDAALDTDGASTAFSDLLSLTFETLPEVWEESYKGNLRGALDLIWTALLSSDTYQEGVFAVVSSVAVAVLNDPEHAAGLTPVADFGEQMLGFIGKIDRYMTIVDDMLQYHQFVSSRGIEKWDLTTLPSKVRINPPQSLIGKADIQLLKALVLGLDGPDAGAALTYKWATTGQHGTLVDATHRGNQFTSSSDAVTYTPSMKSSGIDQINVEVGRVQAGSTPIVIGRATATVEVGDPVITLTPEDVTLESGDRQTFIVTVPPTLKAGATLRYRWATTGTAGSFDRGGKTLESDADLIVYTGRTETRGEDEVTVEVLATKNGQTTSIGTDRARVQVQRAPFTIEPGVATIDVNELLRLTARPHGDLPAQPRYRWTFGDLSTPTLKLGDSTATHTYTESGTYRVGVDLEDAATGKRVATAGATITVGSPDPDPVWKITRLTQVSLTGQIPSDTMAAHPNYLGYGRYFETKEQLAEIADGRTVAYVHALDGATVLPDCFDFDFNGSRTEQIAWPAWIWIQFPNEAPLWCGKDRVLGHYPHDPSFSTQGSSLMLGFDAVAYFNRFQGGPATVKYDYPGPAFATVVTNGPMQGRRYDITLNDSDQVWVVHEIDARVNGRVLSGHLQFIYRIYGGDRGDELVETWTARYEFEATQGR